MDEQALLSSSTAQSLLAAGVPRDEVLAGMRSVAATGSGAATYATPPESDEREARPVQIARVPSARAAQPLPEGWEERFDPSSGRKFYIDFVNQTTSWTRPVPEGSTLRQSFNQASELSSAVASWNLEPAIGEGAISYPELTPLVPVASAAPTQPVPEPEPEPVAQPPVAAASGAAEPQRGFFGRVFGTAKPPKPDQPPPAASRPAQATAAAAPSAEARAAPKTAKELLREELATVGSADAEMSARLAACRSVGVRVAALKQSGEADDGSRAALTLLDALGSTSAPTLQAAICRAMWAMCGGGEPAAVQKAIVDAGGMLYVSALLGVGNDEVRTEAALLLLSLCDTSEACTQLAAADGVPPLLQLLPSRAANLRLSAIELVERLCTKGCADGVGGAGGAQPLAFELVKAAGVAKGWAGGSTAEAVEGERVAGQLLACLLALPSDKVRDAFREASATPALVAMLGTRDESLRSRAMGLMEKLAPADGHNSAMGDEMVATGGIALLCDNLLQAGQPDASRLQAAKTIASIAASPVNAVAIAEAPGAVDELLKLSSRQGDIALAALTAISSLSRLGALRVTHLQAADALSGLSAASAPDAPPELRPLAIMVVAQAAVDATCRTALAAYGVPSFLVAAAGDASIGVEARNSATQAIAHFAADEAFRKQIVGWGALGPLCAQLAIPPSPERDQRTRAIALSAVANVSFVDPAPLAAAGVMPRLVEVIFDAEPATLRMALTAADNLLVSTEAAADAVPQLLNCGGAIAIAGLLQHADADIASHALSVVMHACAHAALVGPLAEAGAAPAVVGVLRGSDPATSLGLVQALTTMCATDSARVAAVEAGAPHALSVLLLSSSDAHARRVITLALGEMLRGDWAAAYEAAGWPVLLAALQLGPMSEAPSLHAQVARATAMLLVDDLKRQALLPDVQAIRFVSAVLVPLVTPHQGASHPPPDPTLALGAAHALAALMRCGDAALAPEAAATATMLAAHPALASALAEAGCAPLFVALLKGAGSPAAALALARGLAAMADADSSRAATLEAGAVDALCAALLSAGDSDTRLTLSLTLAGVLRGDWQLAHAAAGWPALLTALLATAGSASHSMRRLCDGMGDDLLALAVQAQTAPPPPAAAAAARAIDGEQTAVPTRVGAAASWDESVPRSSALRGPQALNAADLD